MAIKNNISSYERRQELVRLLEKSERLSVAQICEHFNISEATARRDLDALSKKGIIRRVHGGAIKLHQAPPEEPILERSAVQLEGKKHIGFAAAELVNDGDTVFLGSGTTVYEVAKNLHSKKNLTIITNSLLVIQELIKDNEINIINIGGILRKSEYSFIGHIAEQALKELRADRVIMGIRAISLDQGLTNDYLPETMTDRAIMGMGKELIIVADHTKCERVSTAFVAPLEKVDYLITTNKISETFLNSIEEIGIKVLLV
jgi:DeoR/GlpR family transcriptional regulator of sugar metabolism